MNNMDWTLEASTRNQEDRHNFIAKEWWVRTPYVLFSRHHWMQNMPEPRLQRWSEMVVYTQIQRSLFEVVPLSDAQVSGVANPCLYSFHHHSKEWNIKVPEITRSMRIRM